MFGKRQPTTGPRGHFADTSSTEVQQTPERTLQNLGWSEEDPRTKAQHLILMSGLTWVWTSPGPVEVLLSTLLAVAPILKRSEVVGAGWMSLIQDENTYWTCMEGPGGSAVLVVCSPDSDSGLAIREYVKPTDGLPGIDRGMLVLGKAEGPLADLLEGSSIVPPWELPQLSSLHGSPDYSMLPPSVRRAVHGSWERLAHDLYVTHVEDIDGDMVKVYAHIESGLPVLSNPVIDVDSAEHVDDYEWLCPPHTHLTWLDPSLTVVRPIPAAIDTATMTRMVQDLVDGVAHKLRDRKSQNQPVSNQVSAPVSTAASTVSPTPDLRDDAKALRKGENFRLSDVLPTARTVVVDLGWTVSGDTTAIFDVDACAVIYGSNGRARRDSDVVFYNNLTGDDGAVTHQGDSCTGASSTRASEQIFVYLDRLSPDIAGIAFVVSIDQAAARGQTFMDLSHAHIRLGDPVDTTGSGGAQYEILPGARTETALIFGELYKHRDDWKFRAIGQGFSSGLAGIIDRYGLSSL